jgi:3D-(3,5/4)-trihydroxycyclohexane-1,2-dione acylhydrolase (decyclizing)
MPADGDAGGPLVDRASVMDTVRLTAAQALVRWMIAQRSELLDGSEVPLFAGVFAIFGHGNVLGLGTALDEVRDDLTTWRGHTEEGMALAAIGYAKAMDRRQVMAATSSIGPGALNMVTAAGLAHANRLPVLLLPGETFAGRAPDPVLQQVEHFGDLAMTVNDAFRPVSRFFDRITRPEQLIASLPQVARILTDPADAGPVVLAMPQDVQAESFDFPRAMFMPRLNRIPRSRPDPRDLDDAAAALRAARRPLLVLGGGVRYSGAGVTAVGFAETHGIPIVDTPAGRTLLAHEHELYAGPLGIIGSASGNALASKADIVLAVGTRLQDFTTASWTGFADDMRLVSLNAARFDAVKHSGHALVGDARSGLEDLGTRLAGWMADGAWTSSAAAERERWDAHIDRLRSGVVPDGSLTYAEVVGIVNEGSGHDDYVVGSSGGIPGELHGGWRAVAPSTNGATSGTTMDLEYGFSCMGYELSGAWGAAMARAGTHPDGLVTALLGDGSYLMLNADLYSAAFAGHPFVAVVCDNAGFAVIHRLQTGQGARGFNNLLVDAAGPGAIDDPLRVDFAAHARSMGCAVEEVPPNGGRREFAVAYARARDTARRTRRPVVVVCRVHPTTWTDAGAWWEVGVPASLAGREPYERGKQRQRRWVETASPASEEPSPG